MRKFLVILSVMLSLLFILLIGCPTTSGETDTDKNTTTKVSTKIVPSKFMVDIPESIKDKSNPGIIDPRKSGGGDSMARRQIADAVKVMEQEVNRVVQIFVFLDEVVKDLTPSDNLITGKMITITNELIEKVKLVSPDDYDESIEDLYTSLIGRDMPIPPFYYKNSDDQDFNKLYQDRSEQSDVLGDVETKDVFINKIYWSDDKKRSKVVFEYTHDETNDSIGSYQKNRYVYSFIYDDANKIGKMFYIIENYFKDSSSEYSYNSFYSITLKEDTNNANSDGVYVVFQCINSSQDSQNSYKAEGYADDEGGYLESAYTMPDPSSGLPVTYKSKEAFNGNGDIKYFAFWDKENNIWVVDNTYNDITYVNKYIDEYNALEDYDDQMYDNRYVDDIYATASGGITLTMDTTPDSYFCVYGNALSSGALAYLNGENQAPTPEEQEEVMAMMGSAFSDSTGKILYIYLYEPTDDTSVFLYSYNWTTYKFELAYSNVNIQQ